MTKLIMNMPDEMHKALQDIAKKEDRVVAAIIRRLVSQYLAESYGIHIDPTMNRGSGGGGKREQVSTEEK